MFQARISMSDDPKLNVNCRSVGVVADGGTCKYTDRTKYNFKIDKN